MGAGGANTGQARRPNRLHLGGSIIRCQLVLVHRCTKRLAHGRVRAGTGNTIGRVAWTRAKMESRRPLSDDRRRAALEPRVYEPWIASRLSRWKWHVLFHGDNRLDRLRLRAPGHSRRRDYLGQTDGSNHANRPASILQRPEWSASGSRGVGGDVGWRHHLGHPLIARCECRRLYQSKRRMGRELPR